MLASIADGPSRISGFASSADCRATLDCIRRLGITVEECDSSLIIHGRGLFGYHPAEYPVQLDAGNSGSTIRMLSGLLAGQRFTTKVTGDESLRKRPMARIIEPLRVMGAKIDSDGGSLAPLTIHGARLRAISYRTPVPSAQIKSCVLLAGLLAEGITTLSEASSSRNHTELMLPEFGAIAHSSLPNSMWVEGLHELKPVDYRVPGDLSSAAFLLAAASALPDSRLTIRDVGINPTRTAFLEVLKDLSASISMQNVRKEHGELLGDITVSGSRLATAGETRLISEDLIPNIIDEIPILAVLATQVEGRIEVRGAKELRIKESDRIRTVANGIRALGGEIEELEDGFSINGPQRLRGGRVETSGDHRIAMAFAIAGLMAEGITEIVDADCASVSFPEFYETLAQLCGSDTVDD